MIPKFCCWTTFTDCSKNTLLKVVLNTGYLREMKAYGTHSRQPSYAFAQEEGERGARGDHCEIFFLSLVALSPKWNTWMKSARLLQLHPSHISDKCFSLNHKMYKNHGLHCTQVENLNSTKQTTVVSPTFSFTKVIMISGTLSIIPSSQKKHLYAKLSSAGVVGLSIVPVKVCCGRSIDPQPGWFIFGIPLQTNPCFFWYDRGNCLLFSLWLYHCERRPHSFTSRFCRVPARGRWREFVARTL